MKLCCRVLLMCCVCVIMSHDCRAQKTEDAPFSYSRQSDTAIIGDTSQRLLVANINITGNKRTKSYIIQREFSFKQGDTLTGKVLLEKMQSGRERLMNTALFIEVGMYVTDKVGNMVFLQIDVKERWYLFPLPYFELIDRNFNEWWVTHNHSLKRVNYGIDFKQRNLSGRNDNLSLRVINGYNQQISLSYVQPYANKKLTKGFGVGFAYGTQHEINYGTSLNKSVSFRQDSYVRKYMSGTLSYTYRPGIKTFYSASFSVIHEKISDTIRQLNPSFFAGGETMLTYPQIGANMSYVNVDYAPYPTRGFSFGASITKRGFSKNMNMWSLSSSATYTRPLTTKAQVQVQGAMSLKMPFKQPYYNSGLLGYGALSMRGMEYYVVDGVFGAVGRLTLRQQIFSFIFKNPIKIRNHERIPFKFMFKVFNDVGYAYNEQPGNSLFNNKLLHTYGFGLDILSIYDWVFTIEYSFDALGKGNTYYHN
jgi:outer membrane protein assembly factor BamA